PADPSQPSWRRACRATGDEFDVDSLGRATAWLGMRFGAAEMTFRYADSFQAADTPGGYQRLLLDAMVGDQSLFTSDAAIDACGKPPLHCWTTPPRCSPYTPGSWAPQPALDHLIEPYHWHLPR